VGKVVVFLACGSFVLMACAFLAWRWSLHNKVKEHWSKAKARGEPTTWEEQDRWYAAVPEAENMALVYTQAFAQLETEVGLERLKDWSRVPLPWRRDESLSESLTNLQRIVASNSTALSLSRRAARLNQSRYPTDLTAGPNAPLSHLAKLKQMAVLLEIEAFAHAKEGRASEAAASLDALFALSRSLKGEPTTISQLVAIALDDISCRSLERVMHFVALSDAQLARLAAQVAAAEATNRFIVALIGERAMYGHFIGMAHNNPAALSQYSAGEGEDGSERPISNPGLGWRVLGFFERDREFFLRAMDTNIAVARLLPPDSLVAVNVMDAMSDEARRTYRVMSGLFLPAISKLPQKDAQHRARLRTALVAVAVERYRLARDGRMPDSLSELAPHYLNAVPIDPFDGQPLRLRRLDGGYVIYSIGADGEDDAGKEMPPRGVVLTKEQRTQRRQHDITFIFEK
jgi:hypothetical protein